MSGLDAELLEAFAPEFASLAARLEAAEDLAAATRALDGMRAMAGGFGIASLAAMLEGAAPLLDPPDLAALRALGTALATHAAAIAATGADLPPPEAAPSKSPAVPRIRTLLVDDSATMRRILRDILATDQAFELVGEAADGAQALEAARRLSPELMLLDIEMPVLDGIGVLRRWALEGDGAVVVVSSAARPGSATALEARRLGAAAVVGKPSGALSLDMAERGGTALLRAARRAAGLPAA
jgi:CheY-like chemotaxis protein